MAKFSVAKNKKPVVRIELSSGQVVKLETGNEALEHPFLKRVISAREEGYGPKPMRFFHWQLEFPEAAFTEQGERRDHFGFDAIVGNLP